MKNQYRGSQNIISEKKVSLDKGVYRGASHNGFKFEKLDSDQNHKKMCPHQNMQIYQNPLIYLQKNLELKGHLSIFLKGKKKVLRL